MNKFFNREEFACRCGCGVAGVDAELLKALTKTREHFNAPITITSGNRCTAHNKKIGGADGSFHTKGMAADFKVEGVTPFAVITYLENLYASKYGIGEYPTWVHLDVREAKARW